MSIVFDDALSIVGKLASKLVECTPSFRRQCEFHAKMFFACAFLGNSKTAINYLDLLKKTMDKVPVAFLTPHEREFIRACAEVSQRLPPLEADISDLLKTNA